MRATVMGVAALIVGFACGFVVGAKKGERELQLANAQYNASILATQLKWIKAGKIGPVIEGMEVSLNEQLARHGQYMESNFAWLWPELKSEDEQQIRRAVAYRLSNP